MEKISIENELVVFNSSDYGEWTIHLNEIKLIGEYTTDLGPFVEDHYLVIIDSQINTYEVPVSASGFNEVIKNISIILDCKINLKLIFVTKFKSRVIYPDTIINKELFVVVDNKNEGSFFHKLFNLFKLPVMTTRLSNDVINYLDTKT